MQLRTSEQIDVRGKRVILRVSFDVHYAVKDGQVEIDDDSRIHAEVPVITDLAGRGAKVILLSWLQRPEGKVVEGMRMGPVGQHLSKLLGRDVITLDDCVGENVRAAIDAAPPGSVLLLENVRFYPGEKDEKTYDENFARELARNGDIFINDAFAQSHRKVASVVGIPKFIPSYAGPNLSREAGELSKLLENPERPFVAVIGGAKISSKLGVINALMDKVDNLLLGGALANTILHAQGVQVGTSLIEEKMVQESKALALTDTKLHIPVDVIVAKEATASAPAERRAVGNVLQDEKILDIGPDTVELFCKILSTAKTVVWNGPMGYFEIEKFAKATDDIGRCLAISPAKTIVGGGETIASLKRLGFLDKMSFVSMGGGAMLEFLEQGTLPGIESLRVTA